MAPRYVRLAACFALLGASTGCGGSLIGYWRSVEVKPNKEIFNLDHVRFNRDRTYSATSTIEGKTVKETGSYSFDGFKLKFRPQAGGQRKYNAILRFGTLDISDGDRKVVLKKQ